MRYEVKCAHTSIMIEYTTILLSLTPNRLY